MVVCVVFARASYGLSAVHGYIVIGGAPAPPHPTWQWDWTLVGYCFEVGLVLLVPNAPR